MLLISRHGKTRLNKYYKQFNHKERIAIQKEVSKATLTQYVCLAFIYSVNIDKL